ncbi:MAG: TonB-dependent receptor [Bacteroidales bacterium]
MRNAWCTGLLLAGLSLHGQGVRDTVVHIEQVEIRKDLVFQAEKAGMKETRIDSTVLSHKQALALSDLLSQNSTVFIRDHGRGALATASFRGMAPSHTRVSWNGLPLNSPMAGMVDFTLIPVFLADEVTLKHGSASLPEGSGGLGGAIALRNVADWTPGLSLDYLQGVGSFGSFDEYLKVGLGRGRVRSKTRIFHSRSANNYPFLNRSIGNLDPVTGSIVHPLDTNANAAYSRGGLMQELYVRTGEAGLLSLTYWGQAAHRVIPKPTSYEGPDNENLNGQDDVDHRVAGEWQHYGARGKWTVRSGFAQKHLDFVQRYRVPGLGMDTSILSRSLTRSWVSALSRTWEPGRGFPANRPGSGVHHVRTRDEVSRLGYEGRRTETSLVVQARKEFGRRLNLNLLVREDRVDGVFQPLLPFLGFDLRILRDHPLVLKGNVARNHHVPDLNDLHWQPGGNPDLRAERGVSAELGLEWPLSLSWGDLHVEWTGFRSEVQDWILWVPSFQGYWEPRNVEKVAVRGLEGSLGLAATRALGPARPMPTMPIHGP